MLFLFWLADGIIHNKKKHKLNNTDIKKPFVSIIIAARNEEHNINKLIKSIKNQTYNHNFFELIIIDDRSNDQTFNKIELHKKNMENVRILFSDIFGF